MRFEQERAARQIVFVQPEMGSNFGVRGSPELFRQSAFGTASTRGHLLAAFAVLPTCGVVRCRLEACATFGESDWQNPNPARPEPKTSPGNPNLKTRTEAAGRHQTIRNNIKAESSKRSSLDAGGLYFFRRSNFRFVSRFEFRISDLINLAHFARDLPAR